MENEVLDAQTEVVWKWIIPSTIAEGREGDGQTIVVALVHVDS